MQTQEQAQNQETIKPNTKVIELDDGFNRKGTVIKEITLIKPNTSHCRGLSLKSVLNFEIDALAVLLTRIALPAMTEQEVYALELMDTLKIAEGITHFLEKTNSSPTA